MKRPVTLVLVIASLLAGASAFAGNDDNKVGPTAWNNRLAALATKGIDMEVSRGPAKKFRLAAGVE